MKTRDLGRHLASKNIQYSDIQAIPVGSNSCAASHWCVFIRSILPLGASHRIASLSAPSSGPPPFRVKTLTLLPLDLECTRLSNNAGLIDKTGRIFCRPCPVLLFFPLSQIDLPSCLTLYSYINPSYARMPFSASRAARYSQLLVDSSVCSQ